MGLNGVAPPRNTNGAKDSVFSIYSVPTPGLPNQENPLTSATNTKKKARRTGLKACPSGLTADATVFAIGRNAEKIRPHCAGARYCPQGVPGKRHLLHLGTRCGWRETRRRLAMPDINRPFHLIKPWRHHQPRFFIADSHLIEFVLGRRIRRRATDPTTTDRC
jgi:hypothetical protein